jgi:hypothetical protein
MASHKGGIIGRAFTDARGSAGRVDVSRRLYGLPRRLSPPGGMGQQLALDGDPLVPPHDGGMGHTEAAIPGSNGSNKRSRSKATN